MGTDCKIAVLISGRGSNLRSLVEHSKCYEITDVFSNKPNAAGLEFAKSHSISPHCFPRKDYSSLLEQKQAIFEAVKTVQPDFVVLAGFMQILEPQFVEAFRGKLVNIHPSLLPAYPGLDTHQRVLASNDTEHGCSVHFVDSGVDTGAVIAQAKLRIESSDTPDSLAARVLALEHRIYPFVVNGLASESIQLTDAGVCISDDYRTLAEESGFLLPN